MAKKEESATKEIKIPEALPVGYSFLMFVEYVVDRVPEFQSVAGTRKGGKLIDAVEKAEVSDDHIAVWPLSSWQLVCKTLESDSFQLPKNYLMRNGTPTDQMVPLRAYLSFADAILEAKDPRPKSEAMAANVEEESSEQETPSA